MTNRKIIVANWKMNPSSRDMARAIAKKTRAIATKLSSTVVIVCPPYVFIETCHSRKGLKNMFIGSQDVSYEEDGAYTGEIGANMLASLGVKYAIVGHSEQRERGDTDEIVGKRIMAILNVGLIPIVCVGEKIRDEHGSYLNTLKNQIKQTFIDIPKKYSRQIIMAYEPIWAIGSNEAMRPDQVYEMSLFVKKIYSDIFGGESALKLTILYGGAVNFKNASEIIKTGKVNGLLIGRESVNMPGFIELLKEVDAI